MSQFMRASAFILLLGLFFLPRAEAADDLVLENEIFYAGEERYYYADGSITAGLGVRIESGAEVTFHAGNSVILRPGFTAYSGSKISIQVKRDEENPVIISQYPATDETVGVQGEPLSVLGVFGDECSGIKSFTLFDEWGNDITNLAIVTGSSFEYIIESPQSRTYFFQVIIEDNAGHTTLQNISFAVDAVVPRTTASLPGALYHDTLEIDLTSSEPATIYYSTDGYPPFVNADNTTAVSSPAENIAISDTTKLQFFAVDLAGNTEETRSELYILRDIHNNLIDLSVIYNEAETKMQLTWTNPPLETLGYHVYRCVSPFDKAILDDSRIGGYRPPIRFRINEERIASESFEDLDLQPGIPYWYGITVVDDQGNEGRISKLVSATATHSSPAQNRDEAVGKSLGWLLSKQNRDGSWGERENLKIITTSYALEAFALRGVDNAGVRKAAYYLRGISAGNNDFQARKIRALHRFGQNVDQDSVRLIADAYITGNMVHGWGLHNGFFPDAFDTALGLSALEEAEPDLSFLNEGYNTLKDWNAILNRDYNIRSNEGDKFGWINLGEPSLFVSSAAYGTMDSHFLELVPVIDYQWILNAQEIDGSFGGNLLDTAGVLRWLDIPLHAVDGAYNYFISQQSPDGSWENDAFKTAMVVRALLEEKRFGHELYKFDGTQYDVSIFTDDWAFGDDDFALILKVKLIDDGRRYHGICTHHYSWELHYDKNYDVLFFYGNNGAVGFNTNPLGNVLFDGNLHEIRVQRSGTSWGVWVDGVRKSWYTGANVIPNNHPYRYVGRAYLNGWAYMKGEIEIISP